MTNKHETFESRYNALNPAQKKAVDTVEGPVMVIAGPGSGKTELLSLRVGNILKQGVARASNILCLTFTETAARNMRERLETLIGPDAYRVAIYTFHGFCTDIISRYPEFFFDSANFRPASDLIQSEILEKIFEKLPYKHILGSEHPEFGYSFLKDAQKRITEIKKGGLSPTRFKEILKENEDGLKKLNEIIKEENLSDRISKNSIYTFEKIKTEFQKTNTSIGNAYAKSIGQAIESVKNDEKSKSLSSWKKNNTGKGENGEMVLKEYLKLPKLFALADIYQMYQDALYKNGVFDYEDMLLQVIDVLEKNINLRTELEEMYQYIMVDEFQDTNNAQLLLVSSISSHPIHEGHPNVCVVGDDDQAIYKFQGADVYNMLYFENLYKDVKRISLIENYRSTQKILDFSRAIVTQGVNRLENKHGDIDKKLIAKNTNLKEGEIYTVSFLTQEEEALYVAKEVSKLLNSGIEAKEIALISRKHSGLNSLLPQLDKFNIPYTYTRKENVFDEIHVKELITLCRFLATVGSNKIERDDLLPEILAFPFWKIDRINIWKIAEHAKSENISWLAAMESSSDVNIRDLSHFLVEVGIASQTTPLEIILDTLIGSKESQSIKESPDDDIDEPFTTSLKLKTNFTSPYKKYYFGENAFKENASKYINFLSALRVFMKSLREYKEGESLRVKDVGNFVDMHISYKIPLINETPFAHNENSVSLLTAHGAKGLEFDYVFVVSVSDDVWAGNSSRNKISFPINLPLESAGDEEDDFIRLFYVALTRARHTLYITHHNSPLRFLLSQDLPNTNKTKIKTEYNESLANGLQVYHIPPFAHDEKALLKKVVDGYMLSPTHLNNFLNIIDGGPMKFIEQNLLRFPQAKTPSSVYGTAIHKALENAHILARKNNKLPKLDDLLDSFRKELRRGRLEDFEEEKLLNRGEKKLTRYYELKKDEIKNGYQVEINFAKQSVMINGVLLNGKIDKLIENENKSYSVVDLKTGKGFSDWEISYNKDYYDDLKLHNYRHQLMMYKILFENSRDYNKYNIEKGILEFPEEEVDGKIQELSLSFETNDIKNELSRFKKLITAVYKKIVSLDFPDTSKYEKSIKGIEEFENDLIEDKI